MAIEIDEQTWCKLLDAILCAVTNHPEIFTEAQKQWIDEEFDKCRKVPCPHCVNGQVWEDTGPHKMCGFCLGDGKVWLRK